MKANEKENFFMTSDIKNVGNVSLIAESKKQEEVAEKVSSSTNWAVLVLDDEKKEDARKSFNTPLVFNIHEAKGLEFKNVILYEFVSHGAYNGIWNIAKKKTGKTKVEDAINEVRNSFNNKHVTPSRKKDSKDRSFEESKFYMNALYVGVSRAIDGVYIIGNEKKCNLLGVIKPEEIVNVDIKKEKSTPEEWKNMALKLIDQGNIEQAKDIVATNLSNKKEYAEEIINALKAKGYHVESDKDKQASSELKAENRSSQDSSTSESKIPKSEEIQSKKRKQHPKEKKKLEGLKKDVKEENTKKLFLALKDGDLRKANQLIRQGVDVNAIDENSFTPLHIATNKNHKDTVELLLNHGADVNTADKKGDTPLYMAALMGYKDIVVLLLKHGADVNAKDSKGYTPLYWAAQNSHKDTVAFLLQHGADVNAKDDDKDFTPLRWAAQNGNQDIVKLLLKHGSNVNAKCQNGYTPWASALADSSNSKVVDFLLADPNINVGCVKAAFINKTNKEGKEKFSKKFRQDYNLFMKVQEAASEADKNKLDTLLKDIKDLLKPENKYGFKPSLNYSPDSKDENTTIKIAIQAGGKLLQLLYDYAEKNISTDTEIFKRLEKAKEQQEKPQSQLYSSDVSRPSNPGLSIG